LRVDTPPAGQRVIDDHVAHVLVGMLESVVVAEGATGWRAAIPGIACRQDRHRVEGFCRRLLK